MHELVLLRPEISQVGDGRECLLVDHHGKCDHNGEGGRVDVGRA